MWYVKRFEELDIKEFEQIVRLRQNIFILEQKSFFEDIDGNDTKAIHIFYKEYDKILAYSRVLECVDKVILGRVTVSKEHRGNGTGRVLLERSLEYLNNHHGDKNIEIVAMSYLREFYKSFGFKTISDVYIMDNHPHEDMTIIR